MSYEEDCLSLDKELAELLGKWQDIQVVKQYLKIELWGENTQGDLCTIPRWTQDDASAFGLMVEYEIDVKHFEEGVTTMWAWDNFSEKEYLLKDFPDKISCVRHAIVQAVVNKLKGI